MTPYNNPAAGFRLKDGDADLLLKLSPAEASLIVDRHKRGLSYETLAQERLLVLGTVKSRLHRALTKLLKLRAQAADQNPVQNT